MQGAKWDTMILFLTSATAELFNDVPYVTKGCLMLHALIHDRRLGWRLRAGAAMCRAWNYKQLNFNQEQILVGFVLTAWPRMQPARMWLSPCCTA